MFDWINNAPPGDLAAELMGAYGAGGVSLGWTRFSEWMFREHPARKSAFAVGPAVRTPIVEAVQLLEHSELVMRYGLSDNELWEATRFGLATLAKGKDAVRQRIKDRTGM